MAPPRTRTVKKRPAASANPAAAAAAAAASRRINNSSAIERAPHVLDPESDANAEVSMEVDQETVDAKAWIKENVEQEVVSLRALRLRLGYTIAYGWDDVAVVFVLYWRVTIWDLCF